MSAILRFGLALTFVTAAVSPAAAQTGEQLQGDPETPNARTATRGAQFLAIPVGARALALGGAVTADVSGVAAMFWNPAGLAHGEGVGFGYSYSELFEDTDITHQYAGVYVPLPWATLGVSVVSLSSGDITRTTLAFPDGGDPLFGGTFEYSATAIGVHAAKRLTDRFVFGGALKSVHEGIDNASSSWVALDVGLQFETGLFGTTIGASLVNLSGDAKWEGIDRRLSDELNTEQIVDVTVKTRDVALPMAFRFSLAVDLVGAPTAILTPSGMHSLRVIADATDAIDTNPNVALGAEYALRDILFLRGGWRSLNEDRGPWETSDQLSGGFGLKLPVGPAARLDYAFAQFGELGNRQVFSIEVEF
ncbi:MAG: PorV/PorQ family protein [Gemmatimonadetes bacterium]|nr:PorV/PorQ family protein [Gemmatimonadota bacterium]